MSENNTHHRAILQRIAHRAMLERGLLPDFSAVALAELERLRPAPLPGSGGRAPQPVRDLRHLLWCSIDNNDSRDLDQLTVAERGPEGTLRILIAVADVDSLVKDGSAIDAHARHNTTSVYTAAEIFRLLPERLSTDLTSLNLGVDHLAVVVELITLADGSLRDGAVYRAVVRNRAKLAYPSVGAWLEGRAPAPDAVAAVPDLADNLRLQDQAAQSLKRFRHLHGALSLETIEARPVFDGDQIMDLEWEEKNRARELIEDFMIAANGVTARYLSSKKVPLIRRVVRSPRRWDRIVQIAAEHGARLPADPDSRALEDLLNRQKAADPLRFPDLSLAVIKLLGSGEYVAECPGDVVPGHFGLAVRNYTHSTAPNRRYTDLIAQRQIKATLAGLVPPYGWDELEALAKHCTEAEDAVNKVERQVAKSAAALLLEDRIGQQFEGLVTGAAEKGTWVRLRTMPVEGKLVRGFAGVDVGDLLQVRLVSVDVDRGFIDFETVAHRSGR